MDELQQTQRFDWFSKEPQTFTDECGELDVAVSDVAPAESQAAHTTSDDDLTVTSFAGPDEHMAGVTVGATDRAMQQERKRPGWFRRHSLKLALGAAAASIAFSVASPSADASIKVIEHEAPAVGTGMVVMEGMWIGGAGLALAGIGRTTKNPLKIRSMMNDLAGNANNSKLFKAGLAINTIGAVGEFIIPAVAVCAKLPPESWGILTPSTLDLAATVVARLAIVKGMQNSIQQEQE